MALTLTITGTNQSINATNGSPNITTASTAGWVVGATVQGTGWATGVNSTKIVSFVANTSAVFSTNFTGTTGAMNVVVSSNNATAIFELTASGDLAGPQNIINSGLGALTESKIFNIYGRTYLQLRIANGARYDDTNWIYNFGLYSYMQVNETYTGTWRSGFVAIGDKLIKSKGASLHFQQARAVQGGTSIFTNSGAPAGWPANKLKVQWNDFVLKSAGGSNYCVFSGASYAEYDNCGDIIIDAFDESGANGSFGGSFGSIEKLFMGRVIGGINTGIDNTKITNIGKIEWFPIPTFNTTGTNPDIKIGVPNNVPVKGFAPIFHQTNAALEFIGVNTSNTEFLDDYILPTDYPLITNSRNYTANVRTYRRTVKFSLNDSNASKLIGVTVYVTSGANIMSNISEVGDFQRILNTVVVSWMGRTVWSSYIAPISSIDTRLQTAQFRKYGYIQQSVSYNLTNEAYSQPIFMLDDTSLAGIAEATAQSLTTVGIDWTTKTITPTTNLTYDEINARMAYELALTINSDKEDPRTISGSNLTLDTGWSLIVNDGITISKGVNVNYMFIPTINLNTTGLIEGSYETDLGFFVELKIENIEIGSTLYIYNVTDNSTIAKVITQSNSFTKYIPYVSDKTVDIFLTKINGITAKAPYESSGTLTRNGIYFYVSQVDCPVYNSYAIDGSTITGFEADYTDFEVDIVVPINFRIDELFAWWCYNLTTLDGIENFFGGITPIDNGNIQVNSDIVNILLDNTTSSDVWALDNRRFFRTDGARPVKNPTTGGGGIDIEWREKVLFVNDSDITAIKLKTDMLPNDPAKESTSKILLGLIV
jgi:hypothetical protein